MKRLCMLIGVAFLFICVSAFAEKSTLIDFSELEADVIVGDAKVFNENTATLMDFSTIAGASWDEEIRRQMKTSLALDNWRVELASSSRTVENQSRSIARAVLTKDTARDFEGEVMADRTVLGFRVHFPIASFNSFAIIKPPFEIPAYEIKTEMKGDILEDVEGDLGTKFDGKGVLKNIGVMKSLEVTVYGSNFPNGFGLILEDQDGVIQHIFMDYLEFDGWKKLVWSNPNYIEEVKNRELRKFALYPKSAPFKKLIGLVIYKDAMQEGGDIVTYVKDIKITYDKAVLEAEREIDDEKFWGILAAEQEARKAAELKRLGNVTVLRILEQQKIHKEEE